MRLREGLLGLSVENLSAYADESVIGVHLYLVILALSNSK